MSKRKRSVSVSLRHARKVVARCDAAEREDESDRAQANYLEALANAEQRIAYTEHGTRFWRKAKRAAECEGARRDSKQWIANALQRIKNPTVYSSRVTGAALCDVSTARTTPADGKALAGVRLHSIEGTIHRRRSSGFGYMYGPKNRTENITLRSAGGRILASVTVAGCERELLARLLAVLMTANQRR